MHFQPWARDTVKIYLVDGVQLKDDAFELMTMEFKLRLKALILLKQSPNAIRQYCTRRPVYLVACIAHSASPRALDELVIFQIALM